MRKSQKEKIAERVKRIQQDRQEKDRLRYSKDYEPEVPDNK